LQSCLGEHFEKLLLGTHVDGLRRALLLGNSRQSTLRRVIILQGGSAMDTDLSALIEKAAAALKAAGAREVYIFGSASRGTLRPDSDVDIAVSGLPAEVFFPAMSKASRALDRPIDLIDLDEDNPFTRYLKNKGELLRVG
jgi:predicted nucleotidyltransferase